MRAETRHQLKQDAFSRATIGAAERTAHWSVEHRNGLYYRLERPAGPCSGSRASAGGTTSARRTRKPTSICRWRCWTFEYSGCVLPVAPPQPGVAELCLGQGTRRSGLQATAGHPRQVSSYPHSADMARYLSGRRPRLPRATIPQRERDFKEVASCWQSANWPLSPNSRLRLCMATSIAQRMPLPLYQELISKPTTAVSKVTAQLQLAELYQTSNQPLDAKRLYEQVKKDNPSTEAGQLATQKLTELK